MEGRKILGWALILISSVTPVCCQYYTQTAKWSVPRNEKVTNLHFFFHDTLSGKNPTSVMVAHANNTNSKGPAPFGTVFVVDDPLTVSSEITSEVIGNAQGLYVSSGKDALNLVSYLDFGFTEGKFNGSSISVFSRNMVTKKERELAVVGGRGKFRLAKGFALLNTYFVNETTGDAIVEYNVTVFHY